ncbi:hypothetical protein K458DRAFT_415092 [Lentithecium fluviatile CBS 122367]|uniref:Uncharacterized protein n=1 Tax=Lentithecium fluviatile CBS 122367 TaxID=1168545 RepID=A0A6G1JBS5_9PLEO|nr:hypothetical protein K458DRAFT_415092 [Lentithecium fluviatile CBS 122367]
MEDVDDEVAAAMGFSSFGATKKRKFDQTGSPKAKVDASGANMTQLGVRPRVVAKGEDAGADAATEIVETIEATDPAGNASQSESHPRASSTNAKSKGKDKQKQKAATGLADFLSRGHTLPEKPPTVDASHDTHDAAPVAQKEHDASGMVSFGGAPLPQAELNALRSGVRDENGDTAYFLPSFVDDPWKNWKDRS